MKKLNIKRNADEGLRAIWDVFDSGDIDPRTVTETTLNKERFMKILRKYGFKLKDLKSSGNYISFTYDADLTERKKGRSRKLQDMIMNWNDEIESIGFNYDKYNGEIKLNDKITKVRVAFYKSASCKEKTAKMTTLLERLIGREARDISVMMRNSMDEQTQKVALQVWIKLDDLLTLKGGAKEAYNRLFQSIDAGTNYSEAMHRNNIFKAADALGIKLPSSIF